MWLYGIVFSVCFCSVVPGRQALTISRSVKSSPPVDNKFNETDSKWLAVYMLDTNSRQLNGTVYSQLNETDSRWTSGTDTRQRSETYSSQLNGTVPNQLNETDSRWTSGTDSKQRSEIYSSQLNGTFPNQLNETDSRWTSGTDSSQRSETYSSELNGTVPNQLNETDSTWTSETDSRQPSGTYSVQLTGTETYSRQLNGTYSKQLNETDSRQLRINHNQLNGTDYKQLNGTDYKQLNGTDSSQLNGTDYKQLNATDSSQLNGTDYKQLNATDSSQLNGTYSRQLNGTYSKKLIETDPKQLNRIYHNQLNGTDYKQLNGTDSNQFNGTNSRQLTEADSRQHNPTDYRQFIETDSRQLSRTDSRQLSRTDSRQLNGTSSKLLIETGSRDSKWFSGTDSKQLNGTVSRRLYETVSRRLSRTNSKQLNGNNAKRTNETFSKQLDQTDSKRPGLEDVLLSTPELASKYGYPVEEHIVKTEDGYLLKHFRIPHGHKGFTGKRGPPVILQHGILCASDLWVLNGRENSLGFILADAGYDVWLTNSRGNRHSRRHITLKPSSPKFWNFSWHEMGYYDMPATVDYVLKNTGEEKLYYMGHSMGTTILFVMTSMRPEYNDKLRLGISLAPVAFLKDPPHAMLSRILPMASSIAKFLERSKVNELFPYDRRFARLAGQMCQKGSIGHLLCVRLFLMAYGDNPEQLNLDLLPVYASHVIAGTSVKTLHHYAQIIISGKFQMFDYGSERNMEIYGYSLPPEYNLDNISAPMSLHYANGDLVVNPQGVMALSKRLPRLVNNRLVSPPKFNHIDFIFGKDARSLLFDHLLEIMEKH